ncbi:hypothetical protein F5884DRAFT_899760 [Xylogone sp. PMI_703]|nr:hypothetical protein F5884DRAFT_899760 [Xylogone sp. PMI_703]
MEHDEPSASADEDYNEPSEERIETLEKLNAALGIEVSRHFWAAYYACDIATLKQLLEVSPKIIAVNLAVMDQLIIGWDLNHRSTHSTSSSDTSDDFISVQSKAVLRDNNKCVLTGSSEIAMVQIFPELLHRITTGQGRADFWHILELFFPEETVQSWLEETRMMYHSPANMFCLSRTARHL